MSHYLLVALGVWSLLLAVIPLGLAWIVATARVDADAPWSWEDTEKVLEVLADLLFASLLFAAGLVIFGV